MHDDGINQQEERDWTNYKKNYIRNNLLKQLKK